MASLKATCAPSVAARRASAVTVTPRVTVSRRVAVAARASKDVIAEVTKFAAVSAAASTLLSSGQAMAAQELVGQMAESDGRAGVLLTLFVPALGWVAFNMLQPLTNQLNRMSEMKDEAKRSVAAAVGLGAVASLLFAQNAEAATQVAQLAESDGRAGVLLTLFVPALGWVGFNMLQPLSNQLNRMSEMKNEAKRSVAAAVGLGAAASLLFAQNAEAATQVAQLAESDGRAGVLLTLFVPALGWVGFNMLQPLSNQLNRMSEMKDDAKP